MGDRQIRSVVLNVEEADHFMIPTGDSNESSRFTIVPPRCHRLSHVLGGDRHATNPPPTEGAIADGDKARPSRRKYTAPKADPIATATIAAAPVQ